MFCDTTNEDQISPTVCKMAEIAEAYERVSDENVDKLGEEN